MVKNFVEKLRNLKTDPNLALLKEEVDVILEVLGEVISRLGGQMQGTFLLYGKADGTDDVQEIISFDLEKGEKKNFLGQGRSSGVMASEVLYRANSGESDGKMSAITYYFNTPLYLRLDTTYGKFTCAYYAEGGSYDDQEVVYCAVAKAIALMCEHDEILQNGVEHLAEVVDSPRTLGIIDFVDELFKTGELPSIIKWTGWQAGDDAALYFEDFYQETFDDEDPEEDEYYDDEDDDEDDDWKKDIDLDWDDDDDDF